MNNKYILLFKSARNVIQAERLLSEQGLNTKIITVPESISTECGMCIEISESSLHTAANCLQLNNLSFKQIAQ